MKAAEDAVSPVVGVMLMVVVTVVIAAVITVFATGVMGDDSSTTPVAMIDMSDVASNGVLLTSVEFVHKGGDVLLWENVEVSLVGDTQTITNYFPGDHGTLHMAGESGPGAAAEAGDYITVTVIPGMVNSFLAWDGYYRRGEDVVWTMYDKRTDGILASGSFVVP